MKLEEQLHNAMLVMYTRAGKEAGYWGRRFLQSVKKNGGLSTARRMLQPTKQKAQLQGLHSLIKARRADLSLEYLVLQNPYSKLFKPNELTEAKRRLSKIPPQSMPAEISPELNFPESLSLYEGSRKTATVNKYERDKRARNLCIKKWGTNCNVCNMSFEKFYGIIGKDFIHVHHLDPLGLRKKRKKIDPIKDLIPVCPNCHAMLHTRNPPIGIEELKFILQSKR
ncbi:MAG: HNH endonuclease [Bacteroidota bacterium]|jgi:5-methylcytosine-specific restriction protein A